MILFFRVHSSGCLKQLHSPCNTMTMQTGHTDDASSAREVCLKRHHRLVLEQGVKYRVNCDKPLVDQAVNIGTHIFPSCGHNMGCLAIHLIIASDYTVVISMQLSCAARNLRSQQAGFAERPLRHVLYDSLGSAIMQQMDSSSPLPWSTFSSCNTDRLPLASSTTRFPLWFGTKFPTAKCSGSNGTHYQWLQEICSASTGARQAEPWMSA